MAVGSGRYRTVSETSVMAVVQRPQSIHDHSLSRHSAVAHGHRTSHVRDQRGHNISRDLHEHRDSEVSVTGMGSPRPNLSAKLREPVVSFEKDGHITHACGDPMQQGNSEGRANSINRSDSAVSIMSPSIRRVQRHESDVSVLNVRQGTSGGSGTGKIYQAIAQSMLEGGSRDDKPAGLPSQPEVDDDNHLARESRLASEVSLMAVTGPSGKQR